MTLREMFDRLLLNAARRIRRRQHRHRHFADHIERRGDGRIVGADPPECAGHQHDQQQRGDDREVDFLIKPAHRVQSCTLANT